MTTEPTKKFFDVDSYPEAEFIKREMDYTIEKTDAGNWGFIIKKKTGEVLACMFDIESEEMADSCFVHSMYQALDQLTHKSAKDFSLEVAQSPNDKWQYAIKDKTTGEKLSGRGNIDNQDKAYELLSIDLMRLGCSHKEAAQVMLEGQGKIAVNKDGTIELTGWAHILGGEDAMHRNELEKRGQQRIPE